MLILERENLKYKFQRGRFGRGSREFYYVPPATQQRNTFGLVLVAGETALPAKRVLYSPPLSPSLFCPPFPQIYFPPVKMSATRATSIARDRARWNIQLDRRIMPDKIEISTRERIYIWNKLRINSKSLTRGYVHAIAPDTVPRAAPRRAFQTHRHAARFEY